MDVTDYLLDPEEFDWPALLAEWAYVRPYQTNTERTVALDSWLHLDNHHRAHTALGGQPPISRVNNPPNSYS